MAVCDVCQGEMLAPSVSTCLASPVEYPDGPALPRVPYPAGEDRRCHDCNVAPGGFHHDGCDAERCPRCGGQLISCGCLSEEEG